LCDVKGEIIDCSCFFESFAQIYDINNVFILKWQCNPQVKLSVALIKILKNMTGTCRSHLNILAQFYKKLLMYFKKKKSEEKKLFRHFSHFPTPPRKVYVYTE